MTSNQLQPTPRCGVTPMNALRLLTVAALVFHAAPAWMADAKVPDQTAREQSRQPPWFTRLAGKFRLEGSLETPGESGPGERLSIGGKADCRGIRDSTRTIFGAAGGALGATGVECFLDMTREPQSAAESATSQQVTATRHMATLLYSIDLKAPGIMHMLVDDEGVAEGGTARLQDDMLVSESPCARIKGKCLRKVRITEPDRQSLKMEVDIEVDGKRVGGQQLTLHRETVTP
jgi:hypothetical protein